MEVDGYGDGSGSGGGYYGDGCGKGEGYYGDGCGFGGEGSGGGYYGDGSEKGGGDGSGYGSDNEEPKSFMRILLTTILGETTRNLPIGVELAFWKSNKDGTPSNGGSGTPAYVGKVEQVKGPLKLCSKNALHGTLTPSLWKGERLWIVALYPPVAFDEDKCGSLKREILMEAPFCF